MRRLCGPFRFGFDAWGLGLFLLIMLPNFLWFAIPAPNDVLRLASVTPALDAAASVLQVILAAAMCLIVRRQPQRMRVGRWTAACAGCCLLYFAAWALYYGGSTNGFLLVAMCVLPCAAFAAFIIHRKNWIALVPTALFCVAHTLFGVCNFLLTA